VDLFFSAKRPDRDVVARISGLAETAGVRVNVSATDVDGHLDPATVGEAVRDWRHASVWFRGPAAFGASMLSGFERAGGSAADFHQETFEFR